MRLREVCLCKGEFEVDGSNEAAVKKLHDAWARRHKSCLQSTLSVVALPSVANPVRVQVDSEVQP